MRRTSADIRRTGVILPAVGRFCIREIQAPVAPTGCSRRAIRRRAAALAVRKVAWGMSSESDATDERIDDIAQYNTERHLSPRRCLGATELECPWKQQQEAS